MRKRLLSVLCILLTVICISVPKAASADTDFLRSADITVRSGGRTLRITGSKWLMLEDRSVRLRFVARPSGNLKSVVWSSSNQDIVAISAAGKVTARAKGTAVITGTFNGRDGTAVRKTVMIKVIAKTLRKTKKEKGVLQWKSDVGDIEKRYEERPRDRVLFYGNSSIRRWETLEKDMAGISVLNHGFGGSTVNDCLYYADRLVIPYRPAAIVFYAGTNDIARDYSTKEVYDRTIDFFEYIHCRLPKTQIYYISMPLQPKRKKYWPSVRALNKDIKKYCKNDPLVTFINASATLNKGGISQRARYFVEDGIHLTEDGYEVWTRAIRPVL